MPHPEVISLVEDSEDSSGDEGEYEDGENTSQDGNERTDLVYRAAAALDYDSEEEYCEGDEAPHPHWHYGGHKADAIYVDDEDRVFGVVVRNSLFSSLFSFLACSLLTFSSSVLPTLWLPHSITL